MKEIQLSDGRGITIETEGDKWIFQLQDASGVEIDTFEDDPSSKESLLKRGVESAMSDLGFSTGPISPVGSASWLREHGLNEDELMEVGITVSKIIFASIQAYYDNDEEPTFFDN